MAYCVGILVIASCTYNTIRTSFLLKKCTWKTLKLEAGCMGIVKHSESSPRTHVHARTVAACNVCVEFMALVYHLFR